MIFNIKKELYDAQLQINSLKASTKKLEAEKEELLKETSKLRKEIVELEDVLDKIDIDNYEKFKNYYSHFYHFYTLIDIDKVPAETTIFIKNCFNWNGLYLFSPFRYLLDENYRKVIDVYADEMNRIFSIPRETIWGTETILEVEKFLNDKLKIKKTSISTQTPKRQQIEKLDMELM